MGVTQTLRVPDPITETRRLSAFFDERGLSGETLMQAVDLIQQRTEVYLRDALAVAEEQAGFRSVCKAGCGYCCHTLVSVVPPEAFFIVRHIERTASEEERAAIRKRARDYARRTRGMDGGARYERREACPFLRSDDWYCGLHTARPLVCRAMHSGSLPACLKAYRKRDSSVPAPSMASFFKNTEAWMAAYVSALRPRGVPCYPVELASALEAIWSHPNALERWLGGEDIFAGCAVTEVAAPAEAERRQA